DLVAEDGISDDPTTCTFLSNTNNDCAGHGTIMLGIVGGTTYGVAKSATLGSLKIVYFGSDHAQHFLPHSRIVDAFEWITDHHNLNPTQLEAVNCSFQLGFDTFVNNAVISSVKSGITYAISAGNDNLFLDYSNGSRTKLSPQEVGPYYALTTWFGFH